METFISLLTFCVQHQVTGHIEVECSCSSLSSKYLCANLYHGEVSIQTSDHRNQPTENTIIYLFIKQAQSNVITKTFTCEYINQLMEIYNVANNTFRLDFTYQDDQPITFPTFPTDVQV